MFCGKHLDGVPRPRFRNVGGGGNPEGLLHQMLDLRRVQILDSQRAREHLLPQVLEGHHHGGEDRFHIRPLLG